MYGSRCRDLSDEGVGSWEVDAVVSCVTEIGAPEFMRSGVTV